jgi:transposase
MATFKKKKSGRGSWRVEDMKKAMESVLVAKMSVREAADRFNLPKSSLQDRISKIRKGSEVHVPPKLGRFERTFTVEYEEELANHIKSLDDRLMPLTRQEFLKLAFSLAEELKVPHRFNKEKGVAGKDFYYDFMKRHPQLSLRTPESTSLMRAVGFNKPHVYIFFSRLREIMNKHQFPPSKIYNADETGVSCVHENSKVISVKGKRQVGKLTSGERGRNIIVMFCMNAGGQFIPPFIIYPRQKNECTIDDWCSC